MRTWLFVPGHDTRKLNKALQSEAEVVVIDWEDAVPEDRKAEARTTTHSTLASARPIPRCVVRINSAQLPSFQDDLVALAGLPVSGVLLPKASGPDEVTELARTVALPIIPIIESAMGAEAVFAIASAHPQVERLTFGALDFVADMGVAWTPLNELCRFAQARVTIASRAAGLEGAVDSVYPLLDDDEGLRRESAHARALGFVGKFLLHPAQIKTVREVFSPTADEVAQAEAIMEAYREANLRGETAVRLEGKFIDPPVVLWAQRILAMRG